MWKSLALGALAGGIVGGIAFAYGSRKLDQQVEEGAVRMAADLGIGADQLRAELNRGREELRAQIRRQVPPLVEDQLEITLDRYGITPQTGRQMAIVLARAEEYGLI